MQFNLTCHSMNQHILFRQFHKLFTEMEVGQVLLISEQAPKHPDKFIEYVKEFIDSGYPLEFSNDYTLVRKINRIPNND